MFDSTESLSRRAALGALAGVPALAILPGPALAAPSALGAGYRGPGVYTGQGVAAIVGAPVEAVNGIDIGPAVSGQFVPVILTERDGRISRFLRAIETSAEFGLTLALSLDVAAVRSLADSWIKGVAGVDPIFAAIERHRAAEAAFVATLNPADNIVAKEHGRKVTRADLDARNAAQADEDDILDELLATAPVSPAGMRAALEYLIDYDEGYHLATFAPTLLKSPLLAETANG
jgi:hypothetical protein